MNAQPEPRRRPAWNTARSRGVIGLGIACIALAACGDGGGGGGEVGGTDGRGAMSEASAADTLAGAEPALQTAADTSSSFQATISGVLNQSVKGYTAVSGIEDGRYNINLAAEAMPAVLIGFARSDTTPPAPGTYTLGSDAFDGTLEVYGDPQRDFDIVAGELEILSVKGDTLTGRFFFVAHELLQRGGQSGEIQVDGTFRTGGKR